MHTKISTWILLRGLTRESGHWGEFTSQFAHIATDSQVIPLDLPGNGQFHQQSSPLSVRDMVEHCRAQLLARRVAPPYGIVAMSLGAMVAVDWSRSYPQDVLAQVLINTSMRPLNSLAAVSFLHFFNNVKPILLFKGINKSKFQFKNIKNERFKSFYKLEYFICVFMLSLI